MCSAGSAPGTALAAAPFESAAAPFESADHSPTEEPAGDEEEPAGDAAAMEDDVPRAIFADDTAMLYE